MGILSNIFHKIFPASHSANAPEAPATATPTAAPTATPSGAGVGGGVAPSAAPAAAVQPVDVEQVLDGMAAKAPEKLNWKTSIVDLMKLLEIDSSLAARKALAQELHYTGALDGSAEMNIWLHRQVMNKVAANGGKVPADLKD